MSDRCIGRRTRSPCCWRRPRRTGGGRRGLSASAPCDQLAPVPLRPSRPSRRARAIVRRPRKRGAWFPAVEFEEREHRRRGVRAAAAGEDQSGKRRDRDEPSSSHVSVPPDRDGPRECRAVWRHATDAALPGPCPILTRSGTLGSGRRFRGRSRLHVQWSRGQRTRDRAHRRVRDGSGGLRRLLRSEPARHASRRATSPWSDGPTSRRRGSTIRSSSTCARSSSAASRARAARRGRENCSDERGYGAAGGTEAYRAAIVQPFVTYLVRDAQLHAIGRSLLIVVTPGQVRAAIAKNSRRLHPGRGEVPRRPGEVPGSTRY